MWRKTSVSNSKPCTNAHMANMALLKCEMKENEFIGLILNVHGPL